MENLCTMPQRVNPFQRPSFSNTRAAQGQVQSAQIDTEAGILRDVVLCQAMQPKGYAGYTWVPEDADDYWWSDWHLFRVETDQDFINKLVELGSGNENLRVRFGHPGWYDSREGMSTYCGKVKNVRVRDNQAIGDIHLSDVASTAPGFGDLKSHVMNLAAEDSGAIMMSICFAPGSYFFKNANGEKEELIYSQEQIDYLLELPEEDRVVYESVTNWTATDFVTEGANTNDLFRSATGQMQVMRGFMDTLNRNPELWNALDAEPQEVQIFLRMYESRMKKKGFDFQKFMNKNQQKTATLLERMKKGFESLFRNLEDDGVLAGDTTVRTDLEATTGDGTSLTIQAAGESPAVGDQVYIQGTTDAPPAGDHALSGDMEGTTITTDDAGLITAVSDTPAAEATADQEANERNLQAMAETLERVSQALDTVVKNQKSMQEEIRTIKTSPLLKGVVQSRTQTPVGGAGKKDSELADWEKEMIAKTERNAGKKSEATEE